VVVLSTTIYKATSVHSKVANVRSTIFEGCWRLWSTWVLALRSGVVSVSAKNNNKNRRSSMSYYVRRHSSVAVWVVTSLQCVITSRASSRRHLHLQPETTGEPG